MDFLRSCYKQNARFVEGDATRVAQLTWYFCKKTALPFPGVHAFGSSNWDAIHPTPTLLGFDATAKRTYYNGRALNSSRGTAFAGPQAYFVDGAPAPSTLSRGVLGTPTECLLPPFGLAKGGLCVPVNPARGGVFKSGKLISTITPGTPCVFCPGITPSRCIVTIAGCTGANTVWNGTWTAVQVIPCRWRFVQLAGHTLNVVRGPGTWNVALFVNIVGNTSNYSSGFADCITPGPVAFVNQTGGGSWPATVAIDFA